jgi:hypothetical protein
MSLDKPTYSNPSISAYWKGKGKKLNINDIHNKGYEFLHLVLALFNVDCYAYCFWNVGDGVSSEWLERLRYHKFFGALRTMTMCFQDAFGKRMSDLLPEDKRTLGWVCSVS